MQKHKLTNNHIAFSLIELSIVLIIIGFLTAAIVGGQSLNQPPRPKGRGMLN